MPTPSNSSAAGQWAARTDTPRRSVFGNYRPLAAPAPLLDERPRAGAPEGDLQLQPGIELALARSFIYRFLAKAYEDPDSEGWGWLCAAETQETLEIAWRIASQSTSPILRFQRDELAAFGNAYLSAFGHAARGHCPLNEIEYGDIKADPLFQPHRLADLAAFYRAFGLTVAEDAGERQDHICLELEFMCVMAAKEAYGLEHRADADSMELCRHAQKQFLREHLGRWTPAFTRRLAAATANAPLRALAQFTGEFVKSECARFGLSPGSHDLALRPVDEAADRMCDSCGISNLPPGALAETP